MKDLADLHTHTLASGHAYNTIMEMVHAAAEKNLPILGISDHAPAMPGCTHELYFCNFRVVPREMEGVRVLFGCELNIIDYKGTIDLKERYLSRLDYAIASLHDLCLDYGTREQNTEALIGAMKNPYVSIIGHPDDGRFPVDMEAVVKAAGENHKLLEVNNASLTPGSSRLNGRENDRIMLRFCRQYGVPVIMGSDAHFMASTADHRLAEELLREMDFPQELVANYSLDLLGEYIPAVR